MSRPANTGGSGLSPGCSIRRPACGMVIMRAVRRQDDRDRELEVIVVATGVGREAFLAVIHTRPSRIVK